MKKPKRARTLRRLANRRADKLADDREKLARLEPGGLPGRPLEVESASQIEPRAASLACLRCDSPVLVASHEAEEVDGRPLRVVHTACKRCGARRTIYFALRAALLN